MNQLNEPGLARRVGYVVQAVLNFTREYSNADSPEPRPDSPAWLEVEAAESTPEWSGAQSIDLHGAYSDGSAICIPAAAECLQGLVQLYQDQMALYAFQSVARSVIEISARAWWVLDCEIDSQTRTARHFVNMLESIKRQNDLGYFGDVSSDAFGLRLHAFMQRAGKAGLRAKYAKDKTLHPIPEAGHFLPDLAAIKVPTGFDGEYFKTGGEIIGPFMKTYGSSEGQQWWRSLSGVAHGTSYALLDHLSFELDHETNQVLTEKQLRATTVVHTAYVAADAYLSAVTSNARLFGFNEQPIADARRELLGSMQTILS